MEFNRILITGGAGFIGSHLSEALLNEGRQVTIIDNLSTGTWRNIDHLKSLSNLRVIMASAAERELLEAEVPKHDLVYHLASSVGVKRIVERPVETIEIVFQTANAVINVCSKYRRPILITSTSEAYGKSKAVTFCEEDDVILGPTEKRRWAYAYAKALGELLAFAHHYESNLPTFIVRLFNVVGPRQVSQYGMVLPTFVQQALAGGTLTIYGDGNQRRCFTCVYDIVDGLTKLPCVPHAAGKVVNLGTQEQVSIRELAERVIELCESKSQIEFIPYENAYGQDFDDILHRVPDLTRAKELIDWNPRYRLDDIILAVADYMRERQRRDA